MSMAGALAVTWRLVTQPERVRATPETFRPTCGGESWRACGASCGPLFVVLHRGVGRP